MTHPMRERLIAKASEELGGYKADPELYPNDLLVEGWINPAEIVDAILAELRKDIAFNLEHGHAPDGYPVEMNPTFAAGRHAAFHSMLAMIDAVREGK